MEALAGVAGLGRTVSVDSGGGMATAAVEVPGFAAVVEVAAAVAGAAGCNDWKS